MCGSPMARKCTVCAHPKCTEINRRATEPGASMRAIAGEYDLKESSMKRHAAKHLRPLIVKATAKLERKAQTFAQRMLRAVDLAEQEVDDAPPGFRQGAIGLYLQALDRQAKWVERLSDKHEHSRGDVPMSRAEHAAALEQLITDATETLAEVKGKMS